MRRPDEPPLLRRILWFAALWLAGVGVTAGIAYGLRALMTFQA